MTNLNPLYTAYDTANLPHGIVEAEKAYQTLLEDRTYENRRAFSSQMRHATVLYGHQENLEVQKALGTLWLNHYRDHLLFPAASELLTTDLDVAIQRVVKPGLVEWFTRNLHNVNLLACLSMQRVRAQWFGYEHPNTHSVKDLLGTWSGLPVPSDTTTSLQDMCAFLYGPATWDIYRNDVQEDSQLARYLWLQEVPLASCFYPSSPTVVIEPLPLDIS